MSDSDFAGTDKKSSAKPPISPARNIVGVVVLIAVVVVGAIQYSQMLGFNAAVKKLETRSQDENADLMTMQDAEGLLGKSPDGPGTDYNDGNYDFLKKTYTWPALLKSYTLTAYYTKGKEPHLHHYETEGAKLEKAPNVEPPGKIAGGGMKKGGKASPRTADQGSKPPPKPAPKPADEESKPAPEPAPAPAPAKDGN